MLNTRYPGVRLTIIKTPEVPQSLFPILGPEVVQNLLDFGQTNVDVLYAYHRTPSVSLRELMDTPVPVLLRGLERLQTASCGLSSCYHLLSFGFQKSLDSGICGSVSTEVTQLRRGQPQNQMWAVWDSRLCDSHTAVPAVQRLQPQGRSVLEGTQELGDRGGARR